MLEKIKLPDSIVSYTTIVINISKVLEAWSLISTSRSKLCTEMSFCYDLISTLGYKVKTTFQLFVLFDPDLDQFFQSYLFITTEIQG